MAIQQDGEPRELAAEALISSRSIEQLVGCLRPSPPAEVLAAAEELKDRDFLLVALMIDRPLLCPDNGVSVHSLELRVGSIQNFKNWLRDMVPDQSKTCLGMEYFCSRGDAVWRMGAAHDLWDINTECPSGEEQQVARAAWGRFPTCQASGRLETCPEDQAVARKRRTRSAY